MGRKSCCRPHPEPSLSAPAFRVGPAWCSRYASGDIGTSRMVCTALGCVVSDAGSRTSRRKTTECRGTALPDTLREVGLTRWRRGTRAVLGRSRRHSSLGARLPGAEFVVQQALDPSQHLLVSCSEKTNQPAERGVVSRCEPSGLPVAGMTDDICTRLAVSATGGTIRARSARSWRSLRPDQTRSRQPSRARAPGRSNRCVGSGPSPSP